MADRIPTRLSAAEGRKFAFAVGTAFLVLAGIMLWRSHRIPLWIFTSLGGGLWVAGLTIPGQLGPVYRAWMGFAHVISKVTTPIFMGVVYYLVIAPVGLVMRLLGRNPMVHQMQGGSYWVEHDSSRDVKDTLRNQF